MVSSNATEVLRRVLVGNDVAYCFSHVFGGDMAPDKAAAIRSFLSDASSQYGRRCEVAYDETPAAARPDLATTVLVTDTAGDVRDALDVGIRAVGVAWGMHTAGELTGAGAEFVAIWPQELPGYLLGDTAAAPAGACAVPVPADPAVAAVAAVAVGLAAHGGGSCGADECHCGCQGRPGRGSLPAGPPSVAARLTAAAAVRRERRRRAAQAPRPPVPSGGNVPSLPVPAGGVSPPHRAPQRHPAPAAELRDAVRRILAPAPGR